MAVLAFYLGFWFRKFEYCWKIFRHFVTFISFQFVFLFQFCIAACFSFCSRKVNLNDSLYECFLFFSAPPPFLSSLPSSPHPLPSFPSILLLILLFLFLLLFPSYRHPPRSLYQMYKMQGRKCISIHVFLFFVLHCWGRAALALFWSESSWRRCSRWQWRAEQWRKYKCWEKRM